MGWGKTPCITWPRRIRERGWPRAEEQQWREVVRCWAPAGGRAKGSASVMPMGRSQEEATPASEETSCQKSGGDVGKCSVMETGVGGWGGASVSVGSGRGGCRSIRCRHRVGAGVGGPGPPVLQLLTPFSRVTSANCMDAGAPGGG